MYNPSGATDEVKASGVEVRKGDFGDASSLETAFAGADKLLIVSYPSIAHESRVRNGPGDLCAMKACVHASAHLAFIMLSFWALGTYLAINP